MSTRNDDGGLADEFPDGAAIQFKPTLILLMSAPLLLTWRYFGTASFYVAQFGNRGFAGLSPTAAAECYRFTSCFLLMGVLPALVIKLVLRERLSDYGIRIGIRFRTVRSMLMMAPVFILGGYIASLDPAIRNVFPVDPNAGASTTTFLLHAAMYCLFYLGWEFYFRGFMLSGLSGSTGMVNAVLIQTLASALLHIGDPASEAFSAIGGGLIWGFFAVRTRSILSGTVQHAALGISLDWFILHY